MQKKVLVLVLLLAVTATLVVRCAKQNQKPVLDSVSWPDSVYLGASVTLSCAVSDPEGDSVTVSWFCSLGTLSAPTGTSVNWQAPASECSPVITVRAMDTHNGETKQEHTIVVSGAVNRPPEIAGISGPDSIAAGGNCVLTCSASDPDGDTLSYTWTCNVGGLSGQTGATVTCYAPDSAASAVITVIVADSNSADTATKSIGVSAQGENHPPTIASISGPDSVDAGGDALLTCNASDPDGDTLSYTWSCNAGGLSGQTGASATWHAPDTAAYATITVIASDGLLADTATKSIGVRPPPNQPPVIDSIHGPSSLPANGSTSLTCFAHDPDDDTLTYTWTCERGRVSPATGRTVTWYAPDTSGNVIITATVRDPHAATDQRTKTINVTKVTTTALDTMVSVPAASYKAWQGTMKVGYNIWGNFSVSQDAPRFDLDINFYVFDSTNYYKWVNNQNSTGIVVISRSTGASYSATIPKTCRYYIVLDNTYSVVTPKIVTVLTKLTSP